ncbi:MAG TPA: TonB-dependent siderophore receptor [Steroidobacteraceae bacterium]|nr:TonB-dependent siderophore receptor [Steroidobacteraceae bacterium]
MPHRNARIKLPASFRNAPTAPGFARTTLALGVSSALLAPLQATVAADVIDLDKLQIEERTIDTNPNAEAGAPYKAKTSGDERITRPIAETPFNISVLTKTQIDDSGYTDLRDILDAQPGITLGTGENGNAFGDRYIIRGQEARSDVFVDGLRDPGMSIRESFATEQVEVSKGPNSSFAGRGTAGGAINSITKQASTEYDFAKFTGALGTDAHTRFTVDANVPLGDSVAVRANLLYGYEEVPDRGPTDRERRGVALSGHWAATDKFDVTVDYYGLEAEDNPDIGGYLVGTVPDRKPAKHVPVYAQKQDFLESDVDTVTARLEYEFSEATRLSNVTRHGTSDNGYVVTGARGSDTGPNNPDGVYATTTLSTHQGWQEVEYTVNQTNLRLDRDLAGLTHQFIVGAEFSDHAVLNGIYDVVNSGQNCITGNGTALNAWCATNADGSTVDGLRTLMNRQIAKGRWDIDWNVKTLSGYVMDTVDVGERWTLFAGVRFDSFDYDTVTQNATFERTRYQYDDDLWNGHFGVTYQVRPDINVYFGYSTASDINGGESDVGSSCGYGGICVDPGNEVTIADSAPEKTENIELGTKWNLFDQKLLLTAAVFQITKDDVMEQTPNTTGYESSGAQNTGRNRVRGIEVGVTGNITERLSAQAGATFMDAEVLESNVPANVGKTLSNFADTTAFAQLRFAVTPALAVGGAVKYESEKYAGQPDSAPGLTPDGQYSQPIPDYTVVDLFADYTFSKRLGLRLNVGNVFDEEYYLAGYRSGSFLYYGDALNARLTLNYEF